MSDLIKVKFVGVKNKKIIYRGDGLYCDAKEPSTCNKLITPEKAAQLFNDHAAEWLFPKNIGDIIKNIDANPQVTTKAESVKGIEIIDENGKKKTYPVGTKIVVELPRQKKLSEKTKEIEEVEKEYPLSLGGGLYELSNGEKIRGKDNAIEAESDLVIKE